MSADNGIYVAEFDDGFRVGYAGAIENVRYNRGSDGWIEVINSIWNASPLFKNVKEAVNWARIKAKEFETEEFEYEVGLEYGVVVLPDKFESIYFDSYRPPCYPSE